MADLDNEQRQSGAGNVFTNVPVRSPRPRRNEAQWKRVLRTVAHGLGAVILLAAGTVWTLRQTNPKFARPGELLRLPPALITEIGRASCREREEKGVASITVKEN